MDELEGALGLVIIPDQGTIDRAYQLAKELLPNDAEYLLDPRSLPHITLYHSSLVRVPRQEVSRIADELSRSLVGQIVNLGPVVSFGGNFIFWNIDPLQSDMSFLREAHQSALRLAQYLDRLAPTRAKEERLQLSAAEQRNVELFGHPLVNELYTPHITLGFNPGIGKYFQQSRTVSWQLRVASVQFVRIGHPGRVVQVLSL